MIDIGANTGLVSLQTANLAKTKHSIHCFELLPRHAEAIIYNLRNIERKVVNEFALGSDNYSSFILTEDINYGNSGVINFSQNEDNKIRTQIKVVDTREFFTRNLMNYAGYVIKSDAQAWIP